VYCRKKDHMKRSGGRLSWGSWTSSVLGWENDKKEVLLDQNLLVEQFGTKLSSALFTPSREFTNSNFLPRFVISIFSLTSLTRHDVGASFAYK
jgi:hypothetical protein